MKIAVLGAGAWATAIASVLVENIDADVWLWCHDTTLVDPINAFHCNDRYVPGVTLSPRIKASSDMGTVMADVDWVFSCIPVQYLHTVLQQACDHYRAEQRWVALSKGIEQKTLALPIAMHRECIADDMHIAVVGGPSFAVDVLAQQPTGVVAASTNVCLVEQVQQLMTTQWFMVESSDDVIGVQAGGAFKNVLSLLVGMIEGAGYQDNTKALFFTKGLGELVQLASALGAQDKTLYGLAGMGDALLTALSSKSRNTQVGQAIGRGQKLAAIITETGYTPEGVNTVASVRALAQEHGLSLPLFEAVAAVLNGSGTVVDIIQIGLKK